MSKKRILLLLSKGYIFALYFFFTKHVQVQIEPNTNLTKPIQIEPNTNLRFVKNAL